MHVPVGRLSSCWNTEYGPCGAIHSASMRLLQCMQPLGCMIYHLGFWGLSKLLFSFFLWYVARRASNRGGRCGAPALVRFCYPARFSSSVVSVCRSAFLTSAFRFLPFYVLLYKFPRASLLRGLLSWARRPFLGPLPTWLPSPQSEQRADGKKTSRGPLCPCVSLL